MGTTTIRGEANIFPFQQALLIAARPDGKFEGCFVIWTAYRESLKSWGGTQFWSSKKEVPVFFKAVSMGMPELETDIKVWNTNQQNVAEPRRVHDIAELEHGAGTFLAAEFTFGKEDWKNPLSAIVDIDNLLALTSATIDDYAAWLTKFEEEIVL